MIERISNFLTAQIRKEQEDIDDERAEAINYGLQLILGEVPKIFLLFFISFLCGVGELTIATFFLILPYKAFSGGFHLKTHLGCILSTNFFYIGCTLIAKHIVLNDSIRSLLIVITWLVGIFFVSKYAPADTENFPILTKKERKQKKILSYLTLTAVLLIAMFIPWKECANAIVYTVMLQNFFITPVAYRLTKNKYGYEVYGYAEN